MKYAAKIRPYIGPCMFAAAASFFLRAGLFTELSIKDDKHGTYLCWTLKGQTALNCKMLMAFTLHPLHPEGVW